MNYEQSFDAVVTRAQSAGLSKSALTRAIGHPEPKLYLWRKRPDKFPREALEKMLEVAGAPAREADDLRIAWFIARRATGVTAAEFPVLLAWLGRTVTESKARTLLLAMADAYSESVRQKLDDRG